MKSRIVFLPVPEYFQEQFINEEDDFIIDRNIPIPVEIHEENEEDTEDTLDTIDNFSIDTIISAMLRVIEERQVEQQWIDYYSSFVLYLRPDILTKLKEIKDNGLDDESFIKAHNLIQKGEVKEGLTYIRGFIERYPLVWNGWFILGWALRLLGRNEDAKAALTKAIELGGDNSDTRSELDACL